MTDQRATLLAFGNFNFMAASFSELKRCGCYHCNALPGRDASARRPVKWLLMPGHLTIPALGGLHRARCQRETGIRIRLKNLTLVDSQWVWKGFKELQNRHVSRTRSTHTRPFRRRPPLLFATMRAEISDSSPMEAPDVHFGAHTRNRTGVFSTRARKPTGKRTFTSPVTVRAFPLIHRTRVPAIKPVLWRLADTGESRLNLMSICLDLISL